MDQEEFDRNLDMHRQVQEQYAEIMAGTLKTVLEEFMLKLAPAAIESAPDDSMREMHEKEMRLREKMQMAQFRVGLASSAMCGLLCRGDGTELTEDQIAKKAVSMADAILAKVLA